MIARAARALLSTWERVDREAAEERAHRPGLDGRAIAAMLVAALVLALEEYYGDQPTYRALFWSARDARLFELGALAWWSGAKLAGYFVVPLVMVKLWRARLGDFGLGAGATRRYLWIYGVVFAALLPILVAASYTQPFLALYPFYRDAGRSWGELVAWEVMYAATFVGVELFFRGFMLFALRRAMGPYAIFAMAIPYCMIHFGKPLPEVCGAIAAGVALGTLALASGSIWCGVLIHVSVAWTMDLLAISHTTGFPP